MSNKQLRDVFNNGFLQYGTKTTQRSGKGKRIGGEFESMGRLAYQEMSCRDSDHEMAKVMSRVLDLKVRTRFPPNLKNFNKTKLKVVIDETEYDVIKVDNDRTKMYLYFYLQEVGVHEQDKGQNEGTD